MTNKDKARKTLLRIVDLVKEGKTITFFQARHNDTEISVALEDDHTHIPTGPTISEDEIIEQLYQYVKL